MRKPALCICESKGTDQLCSNRATGQCLCLCYMDITIPVLPKSEISVPSLCPTWLETTKIGFLLTGLVAEPCMTEISTD